MSEGQNDCWCKAGCGCTEDDAAGGCACEESCPCARACGCGGGCDCEPA